MNRPRLRLWLTTALLLGAAALGVPSLFQNGTPALAQPGLFPNNLFMEGAALSGTPQIIPRGLDTSIPVLITSKGNGDISITPAGTGRLNLSNTELVTTNVAFYPALEFCRSDNANLVATRVAARDWALARTAGGAETYNIHCVFPLPFSSESGKGARLDSFSIAQQITTAALTSNTFTDLSTITYSNNVANAIADYGGVVTITMPTATQANPYLTAATLGTPAFMNTAATQVSIDFVVVMQNTGIYRLYGIAATFTTGSF